METCFCLRVKNTTGNDESKFYIKKSHIVRYKVIIMDKQSYLSNKIPTVRKLQLQLLKGKL